MYSILFCKLFFYIQNACAKAKYCCISLLTCTVTIRRESELVSLSHVYLRNFPMSLHKQTLHFLQCFFACLLCSLKIFTVTKSTNYSINYDTMHGPMKVILIKKRPLGSLSTAYFLYGC